MIFFSILNEIIGKIYVIISDILNYNKNRKKVIFYLYSLMPRLSELRVAQHFGDDARSVSRRIRPAIRRVYCPNYPI